MLRSHVASWLLLLVVGSLPAPLGIAAQMPVPPPPDTRVPAGLPPPIAPSELEEAIWVDGRVEWPAGLPADERAFVVAEGGKFANDGFHRAQVRDDGTFRVAFHKRTLRGKLRLDARYAYLDAPLRIARVAAAENLVLRPRLGGALRCKILPPASLAARRFDLVGAQLLLEWSSADGASAGRRTGLVDADLACEFGGLPAGCSTEIVFSAPCAVSTWCGGGDVLAGRTIDLSIHVQAGITVRGTVVDDAGAPVANARLELCMEVGRNAGGFFEGRGPLSRPDGTFEITRAPGGGWTLRASADRHLDGSLQLQDMEGGEIRDGVIVVLDRGKCIRGVVTWPDGSPAEGARVGWRSMAEDAFFHITMPGSAPDEVLSGADGSFEIIGLEAGPHRVQADALPRDGSAGTARAHGTRT